MKITCQSCQSKYTVSDEKVQGKTVKIKCRKCGATIIVNSSGATSQSGADAGAAVEGSFLVNVTEGDQRTMSLQELVAAYNEGVVTADTYVWSDGMADWQPLSGVDSVVAALNGGAPAEVSAALDSASYSGGASFEPTPTPMAAAPVAADPPRAAARRDPARRSADLFGGGMAAQTAQDAVATSAPLFSAPAAGGLTGQREENSTLFSLSALTAKAGSATPSAPTRTTATKEDSGLIDLRALADAGAAPAPAANLVPDHAGLFPLGVPQVAAPVASIAPPSAVAAEPRSRAPIFILIALLAICAMIGIFFMVKGGGEKPAASADATAVAAPPPTAAAPTAAPTATASAVASASASAVASTDASAAPSAVAHGGKGGRGGARGGAKGGKAPGGDAPAATPKPAGKGNCGCAPGDLMCAMKCSAK
ncbi:MAG TPA: zinc-ribbon domain-containing protein [Byssovorax sp.]